MCVVMQHHWWTLRIAFCGSDPTWKFDDPQLYPSYHWLKQYSLPERNLCFIAYSLYYQLLISVCRLRPKLNFIHWNQEGWKTGLCSVAPVGYPHSLLTLANNTCIRLTFGEVMTRFNRLYKRKAHLHHYTCVDGMELADFTESIQSLESVVKEYETLELQMKRNTPTPVVPRMKVGVTY